MPLISVRPLIVVTGTPHAEGGKGRDGTKTAERKAADVIVTDFLRRLRTVRSLKTPFGTLVPPERLPTLKGLLNELSDDIAKFNGRTGKCRVFNYLIWEPLRGTRLAAVEGWLSRQTMEGFQVPEELFTPPRQASAST